MKSTGPVRWQPWQIDLAGVATLAALTAAGYAIGVRPIAQGRAEAAALRREITANGAQADVLTARREALAGRLDHVRQALTGSRVQLEPALQLNHRLARLVELAAESGLEVHETRSDAARPGEDYDTVPLVVASSGGYAAGARFMHALHEALPDVEVVGFELTGNPADLQAPSLLRFDLAWYAASTVAGAAAPRLDHR